MSVRFYKDSLPGTGQRDEWAEFEAGRSISETLNSNELRAWVDGREVSAVFIEHGKLKDGVQVYVEPIPKDPVTLSIAASIAAGAAAVAPTAWAIGLAAVSIRISTSRVIHDRM